MLQYSIPVLVSERTRSFRERRDAHGPGRAGGVVDRRDELGLTAQQHGPKLRGTIARAEHFGRPQQVIELRQLGAAVSAVRVDVSRPQQADRVVVTEHADRDVSEGSELPDTVGGSKGAVVRWISPALVSNGRIGLLP